MKEILGRTIARGISTRGRFGHCETRESYYYPRSFGKMPYRRTGDTKLMDRIVLWDVQLHGPRQAQRTPTPSFAKKWRLQYNYWKKGKSAGVDNISAKQVKADGEEVITVVTTICNKIWQTGEWPTLWTQSLVVTISKTGNLPQYQNYRMISFISHPSKVMLQIILNRLTPRRRRSLLKNRQASG